MNSVFDHKPAGMPSKLNFLHQGVAASPTPTGLPAGIDPTTSRVCLELDGLVPEEAACVTVNGTHAGSFIGRPLRLDITRHLKAGANSIVITPFAPQSAKLRVYQAAPTK